MNFDKLNRWVSLIANVGVVAGIFFLAIELQQANLATRISARDSATEGHVNYLGVILDPSVLAIAHDKALADEDLSRLEDRQLRVYHVRRWRHYERVYYQLQSGLISGQEWRGYEGGIDRAFTGTTKFWEISRSVWEENKPLLSEQFVQYVESRRTEQD